jgi:hypothetical protein
LFHLYTEGFFVWDLSRCGCSYTAIILVHCGSLSLIPLLLERVVRGFALKEFFADQVLDD